MGRYTASSAPGVATLEDILEKMKSNDTDDTMWSPTEYFSKVDDPATKVDDPAKVGTPTTHLTATCLPCLVGQCKSHKSHEPRPDLRFLAMELKRLRKVQDTKIGRVAVLKFSDSSAPESVVFPDADTKELKRDLEKSGESGERRLYILEDVSNENVEIFCSRLFLDPSFFARHLRVTRWESSPYASNALPLPSSTIDGGRSFLLRYPEVVIFPGLPVFPKNEIKDKRCFYCDCHLYREITFTKHPNPNFTPSNIGVIRRKLSFWSWTRDSGAWVGEL
jgi:hypothetical protein